MSESGGSLAITEKKPQRSGGCVGIFFQLFDWNRRFAKKKLFSKKLLPPVRSKQGSNKFRGDDKLPKLRLIADENSGGFPNLKKNISEQNNKMRSPSLVARLMGLESMPEKPKKLSSFTTGRDKFITDSQEVNIDKELHPQKLQKTGVCERKPITKFGSEALHFKNVLSRSRKHQNQPPPKLISPVKSPRNLSSKNTSRLIGAAAKILEPGLQKNRTRYSLTYSNHEKPVQQFYDCNNCGHMFDISDNSSTTPRQFIFYQEPEEEKKKPCCEELLHRKSLKRDPKPCIEQAIYRKPIKREGQVNWRMNNHEYTHQRHIEKIPTLDRTQKKSKNSICETKNVVGFNESFDRSRKTLIRRKDFVSSSQKKGLTNVYRHYENPGTSLSKNTRLSHTGEERRSGVHNDLTSSSKKQLPLSGDALSALLEQKLKELSNQDEDELLMKDGTMVKKTTTMILQELISALTIGQTFPDESNDNTSFTFKAKPKLTTSLVKHDHDEKELSSLSPGSVLEASFSNESCPSSSFDESSIPGNKLMLESINCFNNEVNKLSTRQEMSNLLNKVSEAICNISFVSESPKRNQLTQAKQVLLNAELILGEKEFSVTHFLLTEVETLASIIWMSLQSTRVWNGNHLEGFTFDSIIEYLDSNVNKFSRCGFGGWLKMPLNVDVDSEMLIEEIIREIRKWEEFAGMVPEDLIDWEMSHGLGKWTDFEIETFETCVEIHEVIIQSLIDEIVIDLWKC